MLFWTVFPLGVPLLHWLILALCPSVFLLLPQDPRCTPILVTPSASFGHDLAPPKGVPCLPAFILHFPAAESQARVCSHVWCFASVKLYTDADVLWRECPRRECHVSDELKVELKGGITPVSRWLASCGSLPLSCLLFEVSVLSQDCCTSPGGWW